MKPLTKKQIIAYSRIQSGQVIYNYSGQEFQETDLSAKEVEELYKHIHKEAAKLLRTPKEYTLVTTELILEYVRNNC